MSRTVENCVCVASDPMARMLKMLLGKDSVDVCRKGVLGYSCTRKDGHDGPCVACWWNKDYSGG